MSIPQCPFVDTAQCNCFYALAFSGLDLGNPATFANSLTDNTVQTFAQSGKYYGADGIAEYLSFVVDGVFVKTYDLAGGPLFLDITASTEIPGQCSATIAERRHMKFNPDYTDNQEVCFAALSGAVINYQITSPQPQPTPIEVNTIDAYLPDGFIKESQIVLDTEATAEFVCDVHLKCKQDKRGARKLKATKSPSDKVTKAPTQTKAPKGSKSSKLSKGMKKCLKKFNELPAFDSANGFTYLDGNSKGCRNLHSSFAASNPDHCPHVSFKADEDVNGFVKCNESEGLLPTDLFSPAAIGMFGAAAGLLSLEPDGYMVQIGGGCPALN
ncbi:hypothetical protein CTEN210_12554 [Chaetoceros tenuissimus]|uniref:Uncharacterized protein n=1 Tax=Chaetoceros tenuissimus TaxID=426638 RepID=A0AAD3D1I7_9STRA|nr:hypothetical protein CTEN210_12554 [Chaetoceros tenuissimus]